MSCLGHSLYADRFQTHSFCISCLECVVQCFLSSSTAGEFAAAVVQAAAAAGWLWGAEGVTEL